MTNRCEKCDSKTLVTDTRIAGFQALGRAQRRRRECPNCGHAYTTYEVGEAFFKQCKEDAKVRRAVEQISSALIDGDIMGLTVKRDMRHVKS